MLERRAGRPVARVPARAHDRRRVAVSVQAVRRRALRLLRPDAQRPEGTARALEARAWTRSTRTWAWRSASSMSREAFPPESKARAKELVANLQDALKARIEKLDWMSDETKQKAIEKWDTFLPKIGYPDKWRDWSGLKIVPDNYFANVERRQRSSTTTTSIAKIGKPTDRLEWGMTPQTVNAYYNPTDNTINFPAAILQPPFFDAKADDAHQLRRHRRGDRPRGDARLRRPGQPVRREGQQRRTGGRRTTATKFDARTDRLVKQFDAYEPLPGKHVNGKLTLGENIADLGGLNVAYDALQVGAQEESRRSDQEDRRLHARPALLPELRPRLARQHPAASARKCCSTPTRTRRRKFRAIAAPSNMPRSPQRSSARPATRWCASGDTAGEDLVTGSLFGLFWTAPSGAVLFSFAQGGNAAPRPFRRSREGGTSVRPSSGESRNRLRRHSASRNPVFVIPAEAGSILSFRRRPDAGFGLRRTTKQSCFLPMASAARHKNDKNQTYGFPTATLRG